MALKWSNYDYVAVEVEVGGDFGPQSATNALSDNVIANHADYPIIDAHTIQGVSEFGEDKRTVTSLRKIRFRWHWNSPQPATKKARCWNIQPKLTYLDISTCKILSSYAAPDNKLSIRYLTVSLNGGVYAGAQYQGRKSTIQHLVFAHHGEDSLQPFCA